MDHAGGAGPRRCSSTGLPRRGAAVVLIALLVGALGPAGAVARASGRVARKSASCAHTTTPVGSAPLRVIRRAVLCLINQQRVSRGLPPLRESADLDRTAQGWTRHMVLVNQLLDGANWALRITAGGFDWSSAAENIGAGYATARQYVTATMASFPHCQNALWPGFSRVGTGALAAGLSSQEAGPGTWTQVFALPHGAHAPSRDMAPADGCPYRL